MQNYNVKFKDFITLDFPQKIGAVYILYLQKDNQLVPFYVGETRSIFERVANYMLASFGASTDFKVGEAIRYFEQNGRKIIIKYKPSDRRKLEEKEIIGYFKKHGIRLLNELEGYRYQTADKKQELKKIREFCDAIIENFEF